MKFLFYIKSRGVGCYIDLLNEKIGNEFNFNDQRTIMDVEDYWLCFDSG